MRWTNRALCTLAVFALIACLPLREGSRTGGAADSRSPAVPGIAPYAPAFLQAPPDRIASLQLYPGGTPGAPPVIHLENGDPLMLEFDALEDRSRQFRVRITHRNRDWERSSLGPFDYIDGFHETVFGGGRPGLGTPPSYHHYRIQLTDGTGHGAAQGSAAGLAGAGGRLGRFKVSGNYLLEVFPAGSGELLFSLPFLVSEGEGELATEAETLYTSSTGENLRSTRLLSDYRYPGEVEFPQFDLHAVWVPDRHWGRCSGSDFMDSSVPGTVRFQQERSSAYPHNYFRRRLSLQVPATYAADGTGIREVIRDTLPHRILLERDIQAFPGRPDAGPEPNPAYGLPATSRNAGYYRVTFALEPGGEGFRVTRDAPYETASATRIYVAGSFNGWRTGPEQRMRYDTEEGLWKAELLIKEGEYHYSYLLERPDGSLQAMGPIPATGEAPHEIMSLVYYRDSSRNYDRLLQVNLREQ